MKLVKSKLLNVEIVATFRGNSQADLYFPKGMFEQGADYPVTITDTMCQFDNNGMAWPRNIVEEKMNPLACFIFTSTVTLSINGRPKASYAINSIAETESGELLNLCHPETGTLWVVQVLGENPIHAVGFCIGEDYHGTRFVQAMNDGRNNQRKRHEECRAINEELEKKKANALTKEEKEKIEALAKQMHEGVTVAFGMTHAVIVDPERVTASEIRAFMHSSVCSPVHFEAFQKMIEDSFPAQDIQTMYDDVLRSSKTPKPTEARGCCGREDCCQSAR